MTIPADMPSATESLQLDSKNPELAPGYFWESLGYADKIEWRKVSDAEWNVMMQSRFFLEFREDPERIIKEGV